MKSNLRAPLSLTVLAVLTVLFCAPAHAVMPEPSSAGAFEPGKGTKASEQYEAQGRAGAPTYEYGRGIYWGPLHVSPSLYYTRQYDNNVFYSDDARQSDWSNIYTGNLTGELPLGGGQHLYTTAYTLNMETFEEFEAQKHKDHTFTNSISLNYVPFSLAMDHNWKKTVDRSGTEFTDRIGRYENTTHGLLEVPFSSFFLETEAINYNEEFRAVSNSAFNHNVFNLYQRVGYDIRPTHQALLEYGHEWIDYRRRPDHDGDADQLMFGLRGSLSALVAYQVWLGMQSRIYDEESRPDFHGLVFRSGLQYDMTSTSRLTLKGDRRPEQSTFDDQSFYVRNRLELGYRKQLRERIFFTTRETLQYNEYSRITVRRGDEKTRRDYVWSTGLALEYTLPNDLITLFSEYSFKGRNSNLSGFDYEDQTVSFGVRSQF